jgi:tRNA (guanine37-N1)-methyltransferase
MYMKSLCIAVPLIMGEEVRKVLLDKGKLRRDLVLEKDDSFLYLPITADRIEGEEMGYLVSERDFQVLENETKNYKEIMEMPEDLKELLPTSFDVIGQVAIIKIHEDILDYKNAIGEALLRANKTLATVAMDLGVEGVERVRNLTIIAGNQSTETIHREYGIELEIDPSQVYFSPRLATEHHRVAKMAKEGEIIIDMFCGIGPFPILIAKNNAAKKIYAIDINEKAIMYLKKNIEKNRVSNVIPMKGDSREIVPTLEHADRIIMNLPHSAFEFLPTALANIKHNGTIHYYEVMSHDAKKMRLNEIESLTGKHRINLLDSKEVHTYSPDSSLYCLDLRVEKDESDI